MQLEKILVLLSVAALGAAENDVEADDVPSACLPACQFTIDLSARCDRQTNSDDQYTPCVCEAQDSQTRLTECASCVKDNGRSDPDDNDVADLMDDCGWDFNDADVPYPTSWSSTTAASPSSTPTSTSTFTNPAGSTATVTEAPTETPSQTSPSSSTTTVTEAPTESTSPPDSMAGALNAKTVVVPLLSGLLVALSVMF
ncbi:hypothetical protein E0Z10_g1090 [Xylaria hypoxylon]|uniref:Extracellular membrane protein CFEM domain-containing protein n=1 Tax=Xylaria hypoxylon TaxID=37992 RepID=A0A4Z0ZFR8_9PEZI|nr:hypothetical protein E0Z10_g1090 [Xylaria hypoxylon]